MNKRRRQTIQVLFVLLLFFIVLFVFFFCSLYYVFFLCSLYCLSSSFVHCIVCPCFVHCIVCPTMNKRKRQTIQWTKEEDRQYNEQQKKTNNTMNKRRTDNTVNKRRTCVVCPFSFGHCVVCPSSFGHCVVCPSSFGHCVVCPSSFGHCVYNDQRKIYKRTDNTMTTGKATKGQTIQWPKENLVAFPLVIVLSVIL
jgi:hypothetical protein